MKDEFHITLSPRRHKRKYIYDYVAEITNKKDAPIRIGGAVSVNSDEAKTRAIHEAIERYYGSKIPNNLIKLSIKDIVKKGIEFLDPRKIILFNKNQYTHTFPYQEVLENLPIEWTEGWSLYKKRKLLVPAFAVYLGYNRNLIRLNQKPIIPITSSGLAIHKSINLATQHGIFELLERDSAMLTWLTKRTLPQIRLDNIPDNSIKYLVNKLRIERLEPVVLLSTLDIPVPITIGLIYSQQLNTPVVSFGLSADNTLLKSIRKSLEEAILVRNTLEILKRRKRLSNISKREVQRLIHHPIYYAFPKTKKYWGFLLKGKVLEYQKAKKIKFNSITPNNIYHFASWLFKEKNIEIVRVNLSDDILKSLKLRAVKVIMTGVQQMDVNHNFRYKNGIRLNNFLTNNIYTVPHPFG